MGEGLGQGGESVKGAKTSWLSPGVRGTQHNPGPSERCMGHSVASLGAEEAGVFTPQLPSHHGGHTWGVTAALPGGQRKLPAEDTVLEVRSSERV